MVLNDSISRYKHTELRVSHPDEETRFIYYGSRESLAYQSDSENVMHIVVAGDTLQNLAAKYFDGFQTPANLWWIIAEYQNPPIFDPTLRLNPGSILIIPSVTMVHILLSERSLEKVL